jgi:hypothetical protein
LAGEEDSLQKPLTFLVILAFLSFGAAGQSPRPDKSSANQDPPKVDTTRDAHPTDAASRLSSLLRVPTLEELNDSLAKYANQHDAYLYAAGLGNNETVPLLLERLRLDYRQPDLPGDGSTGGFDCAQIHLVDALRSITNTDQGMFYRRWAAWWEANRDLPQHQWMVNGFASAGLHVVEPVDERFGLELIEVIGHGQSYLALNAWRLLANSPTELRAQWAARAAASEQRFHRLGAIRLLSQIDSRDDLLRALAVESDLEIRRAALATLNDHLRVSPSVVSFGARNLRLANRENWIRSVCFVGGTLIAISQDGGLEAFDARTSQKLWTTRVFPGAGDKLVVDGDHVILAGRGGSLVSVDGRGHVLWQRKTDNASNETVRVSLRGDDIVIARLLSVEQVDAKTGATKSVFTGVDFVKDADATQSLAFFVDKRGLRSLNGGSTSAYQDFSSAIGVSVTQRSVCVTSSGGPVDRVTCMSPDTLATQWTRPIGRNGTWGHGLAPIQDGSRVFVLTDQDLTAFAASDGTMLWTIFGGQEAHGRTVPTDDGLLMQSIHYKLELRDSSTGEVRRVWPQIEGVSQLTVHDQFAAVAAIDGALWILDLQDIGSSFQQKSPVHRAGALQ